MMRGGIFDSFAVIFLLVLLTIGVYRGWIDINKIIQDLETLLSKIKEAIGKDKPAQINDSKTDGEVGSNSTKSE